MQFVIPRIKPFVEFCWRKGVISFFKIPGFSIDLKDESKFIYKLCCLMDGELSFELLKEKIKYFYPKESRFIHDLLVVLDKEHLIEDCFFNNSDVFEQDIDRWSKNIEFFGSYCRSDENKYEKQQKLSTTRVTILGLGGVGSNVLLNLAD